MPDFTQPIGPLSPAERRQENYERRYGNAQHHRAAPIPENANNGDDERYSQFLASFTKGLKHDANTGLVDGDSYRALRAALASGRQRDFERIPLEGGRKLVNPLAGLAFDPEGGDSHQFAIPAAPTFDSAEEAAEIVENYWMALLRDKLFSGYEADLDAQAAAAELSAMVDFTGPRDAVSGMVTPRTLFRGLTPGDLTGPYISQFLLLPVPFGAQGYEQIMTTPKAGVDFITNWAEWVDVQNGEARGFVSTDFEAAPVHIRNGRDLSQWVHIDVLFQAYFNACLILLQGKKAPAPVGGGLMAPFSPSNPYRNSMTMDGFGTFGPPGIITVLCEVATRALKAVWFQKWFVHRRLRPEAFGGRIEAVLNRGQAFPIHNQALASQAVAETQNRFGSALLPMAFPEGSPIHPAYGAGHATVAGACVTILKAYFDESAKFSDLLAGTEHPFPVEADAAGNLVVYGGPDAGQLTVGGELNKLASNVAIGRNHAGVHWRTDATASLDLGEAVAISVLRDQRNSYYEDFAGTTFTRFNGAKVTV